MILKCILTLTARWPRIGNGPPLVLILHHTPFSNKRKIVQIKHSVISRLYMSEFSMSSFPVSFYKFLYKCICWKASILALPYTQPFKLDLDFDRIANKINSNININNAFVLLSKKLTKFPFPDIIPRCKDFQATNNPHCFVINDSRVFISFTWKNCHQLTNHVPRVINCSTKKYT